MNSDVDLMCLLLKAKQYQDDGSIEMARSAYLDVWYRSDAYGDDYHACIAAHMLGIMDSLSLEEKLLWHLASLDRANRVGDGRTEGFYASIHTNLGYVYVQLGRHKVALKHYCDAQRYAESLRDDEYATNVKTGIAEGLQTLHVAAKT